VTSAANGLRQKTPAAPDYDNEFKPPTATQNQ